MALAEALAKQARLPFAQVVLILFDLHFGQRGWMPALFGSVAKSGEGRDIDVMLVEMADAYIDQDDIIEMLLSLGFEIRVDKQLPRDDRLRGLVCLWNDNVIDITLVAR